MKNKVLAFVGDGEGKTSAAIGHVIRAEGHNKKTAIIQFLKGNRPTGEYNFLRDKGIEIHHFGLASFIYKDTDKKPHIEKAQEWLNLAKQLIESNKYFLIILDEILDAVALDLIPQEELQELIEDKNLSSHIIITGRILPPELSTKVDLITKFQKIKHYYDKGEKGIEGLDW